MVLASRAFLGPPPEPPTMHRRTRVSSFSSVRSSLSWNCSPSTILRRMRATSFADRSMKSNLEKQPFPREGKSVRHFWTSPRFPATTRQSRCGHSVPPETLSNSLLMASRASSPTRLTSLSVSTSCTRRTPPSAALTIFFHLSATSPELHPAVRSFWAASTRWPLLRTPSFTRIPASRRAAVLTPEPGPPVRKAKCRARALLSPTTEQRRRWTSMKLRVCLMASFTSFRPTTDSSSLSRSKVSRSGAGDITSCLTSSSASSGGTTSISSCVW
mmetsp:Transcript_4853/g.13606  ORF Transcript_4853/g.13606 Transcript_4853/m.13606 type:complete len:272 (+) Transcript_4853:1004-1819(+)